jgi:hypothetical protein
MFQEVRKMAHLKESNPVHDILTTPDCLDIEGAREVQLTDSSGFREALASNPDAPRAEVYEWRTTKLPAHEVLPMTLVKDLVVSLSQDVEASKNVEETQKMSLDEFRAWLIEGNPRYGEFFQKMPRLFRMIVSARNTPVNIGHIMKLIEMRRHQETSGQTLEQKQTQVSQYFQRHFARAARPGEEEEAVRTGRGFRGTPVTRDQVREELAGRGGGDGK